MDGAGAAASPPGELGQAQIICVIGVLGGPGVGKGTQCVRLAEDLGAAHLSVGDLLRTEAKKELSEQKTDIMAVMGEGKLVPIEIVQTVLKSNIDDNIQRGITRILLDGFPRSMEQRTLFETSGFKIKAVLWFHASRDTLLARVLNRAKTSGRVDDTEAIFEKRYQGFLDESKEIIRFSEQKQIIFKVDCDRPLGDIYGETMELVKRIFCGERNEGESLGTAHDDERSQT
ncbi:MAG: hypothetical protein ASARMPRED_007213 [Alectoria sarmentosa]|nr:MAG: hypothetical protein ASARMPRED_007213 [Alectoria sarmentosa]